MKRITQEKREKGITLVALVVTIVVLLILAGVSINLILGQNGLIAKAKDSAQKTQKAANIEKQLANGKMQIDGVWYDSIDDYLNGKPGKPPFDAEEWDKKAAPEDAFIWQSDDKNDEGYGVVVGYTANIDNYPTLRYPSRCTKIAVDKSYITGTDDEKEQIRSYTKNIKEIELPNTVTELSGAFGWHNFQSLKKVTIPNSVISIGDYAFQGCKGLTSVTIPDSVTSIGKSAFYYSTGLTSVTIPNSVTSIGSNAFEGCKGLTSVTIPDSVTSIGNNAFQSCKSLTSVAIPNSVTSIKENTFFNCTGLTSVTIPDSVKGIGEGAFMFCPCLASVTIPDSVTSIGSNAFYNVPHIYYNGTATGSPWGAKAIN